MIEWRVKQAEKYHLELEGFEGFDTPIYRVTLKWDGCVHFYSLNPTSPGEEPEYIHLCGGFAEIIEIFKQLNAKAVEYFKDEPAQCWKSLEEV